MQFLLLAHASLLGELSRPSVLLGMAAVGLSLVLVVVIVAHERDVRPTPVCVISRTSGGTISPKLLRGVHSTRQLG